MPECIRSLSSLSLVLVAAVTTLAVARPAFAGSPSCAPAPLTTCRSSNVPDQTRIWLHNRSFNPRDTIVWKWRRGATTAGTDFADPVHNDGYAMCIYAAEGSVLFEASIPSGGDCGGRPCWRPMGDGFHYRSGMALPDGITKVILRPGTTGSAKVIVKGRGIHLGLPPFPLTPPVTVQLQREGGPCWSATYETQGVRINDGSIFRGRAAY